MSMASPGVRHARAVEARERVVAARDDRDARRQPQVRGGPGQRLPTGVAHSTTRPNRAGSPPPAAMHGVRRVAGHRRHGPDRLARRGAPRASPRAAGTPRSGRGRSGSCSASQRSWGSGPSCHDGTPRRVSSSAVIATARVSSHVMAGRSGVPSAPTQTVVGPWPTTEMARTRGRRARGAQRLRDRLRGSRPTSRPGPAPRARRSASAPGTAPGPGPAARRRA